MRMGVVRIMVSRIMMIDVCNIGNELFLSAAAQCLSSISTRHLEHCRDFPEAKIYVYIHTRGSHLTTLEVSRGGGNTDRSIYWS